jgi:hypothetical protein
MKTAWLITIAIISLAAHVLSATDEALPEANNDSEAKHHATTKRAFEQVAAADFVVSYSTDGKLNIGVGRTDRQGVHSPIAFSPEELERFFDNQRHKDLIVVVVAKNVWSDEEVKNHVLKLRDYFVARGYKKVVIQQGSGSGRGIHLEHDAKAKAEQAGAGQPATRPESKSEGSDKPQPEAEGRSR